MMAVSAASAMPLSRLLEGFAVCAQDEDRLVEDLTLDSREVRPGTCFVALAGSRDDGVRHVDDAVARGAVAVVCERALPARSDGVPLLHAPALRSGLGALARRFFAHPSADLMLCAVTGTNGKTSVAHLFVQAVALLGGRAGYLGTLGAGDLDALAPLPNTTPDVITIQRWLARFRAAGCTAAALEASSHGLAQDRLAGLDLFAAAFTNLGHDHLDYHRDLEDYAAAKRRLFAHPGLARVALNVDDALGARIARELPAHIAQITCSSHAAPARLRADAIVQRGAGLAFRVTLDGASAMFETALAGRFNVDNLLLVTALLHACGYALDDISAIAPRLRGVPGRAEPCGTTPRGARVIVDFAHSPDSLAAILATMNALGPRQLWLVFGCGGERDRSKRPLMGAVAEQGAAHVIVTSDNSRGEAPRAIAEDILAGMQEPGAARVILDRAAAIRCALAEAGPGDIVLIAGKGHETTQEQNGRRTEFSDQRQVAQALAEQRA